VELPTVADKPRPSADTGTSIATPQQAMRLLEARRAWTYSVGLGSLCAVAVGVVAWLGGDPFAQRIHMAGLGATALVMGLYAILRRDPARYRPHEMFVLVAVAMVANGTGFLYWGVYSAFLAAISASGYAFASVASRRGVIITTTAFIAMYGGIGAAQYLGWISEHGLVVPAPWASDTARVVALVMIALITIAAIAGGMDTSAQMQRILDEHHAALRELSQRDAQLAEAHQEARDARAPGEGRHTGAQLGRFRLGEVLGRGAMGEVYSAVDERGEPAAVKVLAAHLIGNDDALRRFHREARAIASLDAPNIVRMLEVSPPSAALPYLAMERLEGNDLAWMLKQQPVREVSEVVRIVREVAAGLDAAHDAGVVHRDLKPANLFAARSAGAVTWKILDFGVSKLSGHDATATAGQLVGTPGYMAPEQARGDELDRRADVYALGVVAYRMLAGRPAVLPADPPAMLHEVVYRMPPQPSQIARVSLEVEAVLAVALAKDPRDRFATAGELAAALAEAAAGVPSPYVLERATALIRRAPWGQWLRGADRKVTASDRKATELD
jgi:serine/threonine-protein kinase